MEEATEEPEQEEEEKKSEDDDDDVDDGVRHACVNLTNLFSTGLKEDYGRG